jgi:hypothetical protein
MSAPSHVLWLLVPFAVATFALPSSVDAQQPKLDIKLFAGVGGTTFVSMLESGRERETFVGWQIGVGPRVRKRRWFLETQLSFNRWALRQSNEGIGLRGRVNSFELPFIGGYIPYKNAFFKLFIYGAYVNHFNTHLIATATFEGESADVRLRPKEVDLAIYQAIARFGIGFDLAVLNFDFNYSISMNSATSTSYRTGYHQIQFNLAYLF